MRSVFAAIFFQFLFSFSQAQQYHFAYLQTDNKQPFYVRFNDKTLSSSSGGYLVIPKLTAGKYNLIVGFPKNQWPLQNITLEIKDKDLGYLLKNFGEKGWGLYNYQTMEVVYTDNQSKSVVQAESASTGGSGFSDILADVVNTPSIKTSTPAVKDTPKEKVEVVKESATVIDISLPEKQPGTKDTAQKQEVSQTMEVSTKEQAQPKGSTIQPTSSAIAPVRKINEVVADTSRRIVYAVANDGILDTVAITLDHSPVPGNTQTPRGEEAETKKLQANEPENASAENSLEKKIEPVTTTIKADVKREAAPEKQSGQKSDPRFMDIELPNPNSDNIDKGSVATKAQAPVKDETPATSPLRMINSDCKKLADDDDFLKTRKKMAAENNEADMVSAAQKQFKSRCYSTEQIKNLAALFLTDEGKYKLFDAAYPFIHDTYNFPSLESEMQEEYYKTRFRAMIKK